MPEEAPQPPEVFDLQIVWEDIDSIKPHPENPRRGDIEVIRESIRANGLYAPIYVRSQTKRIIAHRHVWEACKLEGLAQVPVVWLDVNVEQARRIMLADNGTSDVATNDDAALLAVLSKLADTREGLFGSGYTDDAMSVLRARVEGEQVIAASSLAGQVPPRYVPDGEQPQAHVVMLTFTPEQFAQWNAYIAHVREQYNNDDEAAEVIVLEALHAYGDDGPE